MKFEFLFSVSFLCISIFSAAQDNAYKKLMTVYPADDLKKDISSWFDWIHSTHPDLPISGLTMITPRFYLERPKGGGLKEPVKPDIKIEYDKSNPDELINILLQKK